MIEHAIKAATCRTVCGDESGTGWLIAKNRVLTARHCVLAGLTGSKSVELFFPHQGGTAVAAKILAQSEEHDACLLSLDTDVTADPLPLSLPHPREGEAWQTFGYPQSKSALGHRLAGKVAQVLGAPILKIDLDLSVDPAVALQNYKGLSGSAVVCDGAALGMIRLKVDGTVAALSLQQMQKFLTEHGVNLPSESQAPAPPLLAERGNFSDTFAKAVRARAGSYLFLEGAHGYGKSTFCAHFVPTDQTLLNLGAYCLSQPDAALGPDYRAQPPVFFDWLVTEISTLIAGQPPRKEERNYSDLIRKTGEYLTAFSQHCTQSQRHGLIFIDGLNEVPAGPLLTELLGLLPAKLPPNLTVVLTAPNYATIAVTLGGRVKSTDVLALPPLPDSSCYQYCLRRLKPERRLPALIERICEKARGHPLYLRYLIEHANHQTSDDSLDEFPVLTGPIEEYYRGIWAKLLPDEGAVNLLGLMARLRWGIRLEDFAKALTSTEQAQFVSVTSRIRHLLAKAERTTIYHASFGAFIIEQTAAVDSLAYRRLADFCRNEPKLRYCVLNRVFHLLRVGDNSVFADCNQTWIDSAVTLGVEPDTLLADVDAVVKHAVKEAPPDEFFRLTLLSQRISFRYDTLFALSARLIAEALITVGQPSDALQHVLRFKTLIVSPGEALQIGFLLHRYGYDQEALMILDRVQDRIMESYRERMQLPHFLQLCSWHIQTIFLMRLANGGSGMNQVMKVMELARRACQETIKDMAEADQYLRGVDGGSVTYFLTFRDEYADLARLKEHVTEIPPRVLPILCTAFLQFEKAVDDHNLSKSRNALGKLFADLAELVPTAVLEAPLAAAVTDSLVRFGAPTSVVQLFGAKGGLQTPRPLKLKAKNDVDVDHSDLQECHYLWRVAAFLDPAFACPEAGTFYSTTWEDALERLCGALYWCEGRARRAKADGDETARIACRDLLRSRVLDQLNLALRQRAHWQHASSIPENFLPGVYRLLAELLADCFPEELPAWLGNLSAGADSQWGMYSEGFRQSAFHVLDQLTRDEPSKELTAQLLPVLQSWRDHVLRGVENRHELVPELLRLIPFFVNLGASEEADRLYQHLLSVSMGPTWYKEDQFALMTDVLSILPVGPETPRRLPQIAGYLERASGEMTFQRYVRAEKSTLIGQIARQGKYGAAVAYFRRECCGSMAELWAEAEYGPIDKVGPLRGSRFPGGAIDDQTAALALVENATLAPWAVRWALLEIFQCGDARHLDDYGEAFANIANEVGAVPELVRRATILADAETPTDDRTPFAQTFRNTLKSNLHPAFASVLAGTAPPKPPQLAERPEEDNDDDEHERGMHTPGIFGRRKALREADKIMEEARRQLALGNRQAAKAQAIKMLQTAQDGDWGIWGNLSDAARKTEAILLDGETNAANVLRYFAPLLEAERHTSKWIPAQHLIGKVGPLLTAGEGQRLLEAVIDHVRLMVGDATAEIKAFAFLASDTPEKTPAIELFQFIVWLCDHPQGLRRDRAAAMLLWLMEQSPDFLTVGVETAFSLDAGYGPDVLCGVLDGASAREPLALWDKISGALDLAKISKELRHPSRMTVLLRLATRAAEAGSASAKVATALILQVFTGRRGMEDNPQLPPWALNLTREWRLLDKLVNKSVVTAWTKEMAALCAPLSIPDARVLEQAVSTSFRESGDRPLNRWESKLRYALNLALWPEMSGADAGTVEVILRPYNPSQPERTVQARSNPITDQLLAAIDSGDFSAVLGSNATVLLSYHDNAVKPTEDGASLVEVLGLLLPVARKKAFFAPKLEQVFRSSELPVPAMASTPFETCCRLDPEVVFFGSFTPATPLPSFRMMVGAKDADFVRENWRHSRRNGVRGFGQPQREGCSLSVARTALRIPAGFKLAWMIWLDGQLVAFVDEKNNPLI